MVAPPHNIPSTPLSSFKARVQWAIENRQVYTYDDSVDLNVHIPEVGVDQDDEDIKDLQGIYEFHYQKKKERKKTREENKRREEERAREEENKRREEEKAREEENRRREEEDKRAAQENKKKGKERILQEKMIRKPDSALQTAEKNPTWGLQQQKRRWESCDTNDNYETVRPTKIAKKKVISTLWVKYDTPCERCDQKGATCHKQHPVLSSCYECRKGKTACSFVSTAKNTRGTNRKKSPSESSSCGSEESDEEDNHPTFTGLRRSSRNLGSTYSSKDTSSKIVIALESINTTIRDGFDDLKLAIEKLSDRGDH